ncbi:MAG: hypothetical protein RL098_1637, partial [Bacteroidota bacterium]
IVLEAGLEPARANAHRILSPACLPIPPLELKRARNGIRTRDPDLGKVVLYQLSYSRLKLPLMLGLCLARGDKVKDFFNFSKHYSIFPCDFLKKNTSRSAARAKHSCNRGLQMEY